MKRPRIVTSMHPLLDKRKESSDKPIDAAGISLPKLYAPELVFIVLAGVNLLNYVDRGIVPGAVNEMDAFVASSMHSSSPDVYVGLLQSAFIVGFAVASFLFGHLVHFYSPFALCGVGLSIWCVAVIWSGLAYSYGSYGLMVCGRCVSGVGEASFQCSVPPWIDKHAPPGKKGTWLAIFFTAIPVGTAIGYTFSSFMATGPGVQWAFYVEAFLMFPMVIFLFAASRFHPLEARDGDEAEDAKPPTLLQEIYVVFSTPMFLCLVAGYAAQTGGLIGISTFGSSFFMGLGYFGSESEASTLFGAIVSLAGIVGTPAGGFLLDKMTRNASENGRHLASNIVNSEKIRIPSIDGADETDDDGNKEDIQRSLQASTKLMTIACSIGAAMLCLCYPVSSKGLFLFMVAIGCTSTFSCTSATNMAIMKSVPHGQRAFAMAMTSVCIHAFGDVPSPILAGLLKDRLAPGCAGVDAASSACRADAAGLRLTMLVLALWLAWTVIFFGAAWFLSYHPSLLFKDSQLWRKDFDDSKHEPLLEQAEDVCIL